MMLMKSWTSKPASLYEADYKRLVYFSLCLIGGDIMIKRWFYKLWLDIKVEYYSWKLKKALDKWVETDEKLKTSVEELKVFNRETIELSRSKYHYY